MLRTTSYASLWMPKPPSKWAPSRVGARAAPSSRRSITIFSQWWEAVRERFAHITTLVINVDNGPENHSRRTQFMQRLVEFVQQYHVMVRLAYYPPYHSKYNPIERCWGILENHWNGALLDSIDTVLRFAATMTWKGTHPFVTLVTTTYQTGVTLTKEAMEAVEAKLKRLPHLGKWFVDIVPTPSPLRAS